MLSQTDRRLSRRQFLQMTAQLAAAAALGAALPVQSQASMKALPRGLAQIISMQARYLNFNVSEFNKKYQWVAALAAYDDWSLIQPNPNGPLDFSYMDYLANVLAPQTKKKVIFILRTGDPDKGHTPSWIFDTYHRPRIQTNAPDNPGSSVVPWDPFINQRWTQVVSQVAQRYDNNEWVAAIYISGVQAHYPEMLFPASPLWDDAQVMQPDDTFDFRPDGAVYSQAWNSMLDWMLVQDTTGFHHNFQRTWVINMLDDVPNPKGGGTMPDVRQSVAANINQSYAGRATAGTANLGFSTVVATKPAQKYLDLSSRNMRCPIVYELGPRKQSLTGEPNQVLRAIQYGVQQLGCHLIMTLPPTWASQTWVNEMQQASKFF